MGGVSVTLDRQKVGFFSEPYLRDGKTPIARCADAASYQTLADIDRPEVRVIVNPGGTNERFDRAHLHEAEDRRSARQHDDLRYARRRRRRRDDHRRLRDPATAEAASGRALRRPPRKRRSTSPRRPTGCRPTRRSRRSSISGFTS